MTHKHDDHFPEDGYTPPGSLKWSKPRPPAKLNGILGILTGAVLAFALMKGIEKLSTQFRDETPINPPPEVDNLMGPCFNALSKEDKCAVIFAIITNVRPKPDESRSELSQRLYERGEDWSAPERVKFFREELKEAEKSINHKYRFLAEAAHSIASVKAASIGDSAQSK